MDVGHSEKEEEEGGRAIKGPGTIYPNRSQNSITSFSSYPKDPVSHTQPHQSHQPHLPVTTQINTQSLWTSLRSLREGIVEKARLRNFAKNPSPQNNLSQKNPTPKNKSNNNPSRKSPPHNSNTCQKNPPPKNKSNNNPSQKNPTPKNKSNNNPNRKSPPQNSNTSQKNPPPKNKSNNNKLILTQPLHKFSLHITHIFTRSRNLSPPPPLSLLEPSHPLPVLSILQPHPELSNRPMTLKTGCNAPLQQKQDVEPSQFHLPTFVIALPAVLTPQLRSFAPIQSTSPPWGVGSG